MRNSKTTNNAEIQDEIENSGCTCKGIRTCLQCEGYKAIKKKEFDCVIDLTENIKVLDYEAGNFKVKRIYIERSSEIKFYQNLSDLLEENKAKISEEINLVENKIDFNENFFDGFYLINNFLNSEESEAIVEEMNSLGWNNSQSGRKKQDYGVKINYKKRKVRNINEEVDFPAYLDKYITPKINAISNINPNLSVLKNYSIAEMGNLYYSPLNGACIDPHIDDYWIWGRIVGLNLLSDCKMTFSKDLQIDFNNILFEITLSLKANDLYIMTGHSRYTWKHSIKRDNIISDRMVITLREYEAGFKKNNH